MSALDTRGYLIGLDLGQSRDFTAISVLTQRAVPTGETTREATGFSLDTGMQYTDAPVEAMQYECIHLDRWRGESYNNVLPIVTKLEQALRTTYHQEQIAAGISDRRDPRIDLLVDRTGVGRAVLDNLRAAGLEGIGITIHGGDAVTQDGIDYRVPKRDLVGVVQVLLQNRQLKIAQELALASVLSEELTNFRAKTSLAGHDSYGAGEEWRENNHDDLVLAVALATWYGEQEAAKHIDIAAFYQAWSI